ncbi:sporulation protein [Amycolatopsis sp. H20-H5]|uniref:sporulation protein n=1 Tax=Amycolatopsis sp. H20-H5 TaxID=3046309 RepID=UPI002DB8F4F6|nr:sporulation protein [Amycolatopsis sp. H20-H5]MEC3980837.1 sporulation protein [Amycolatopsis sp. H20-H5]
MVDRAPNTKLQTVIAEAGISAGALAARVTALAAHQGHEVHYTHRSVANWTRHGIQPKPEIRTLIADSLAERRGRWVSLAELGFCVDEDDDQLGLYFPREPAQAVFTATRFWSQMQRRAFLSAGLGIGAYATPVRRWLTTPADRQITLVRPAAAGLRVGRADIDDLLEAADDARRWDSRHGGGNWRLSAVGSILVDRATPLLHGTYTDAVGRRLFSATAQLSRLAGWTSFDAGLHGLAQRHYITALRQARTAGDVPLGGYILASMALQASLCDYHDDAIDMAQAASAVGGAAATPRTRSFFYLIEARAHARAGDTSAAQRALGTAETLLGQADARLGEDPAWIDFHSWDRLSADAVEIFRDLEQPLVAQRWSAGAESASEGFRRSAGLGGLVLAGTYLQSGALDLDAAVVTAQSALASLASITSARATDYAHDLAHRLTTWAAVPQVSSLISALSI